MDKVREHYNEALEYFPEDRIVGVFLQGSQNYGLDVFNSDVDTKLIITPTFEELVFNKSPHSTTHIRANDEHIDFKDIRLYMLTFRKQNLNFLEILYTPYKIVNPKYEKILECTHRKQRGDYTLQPLAFSKVYEGYCYGKISRYGT
jgi:predicted nucleotidyltransferase